MLGSDVLEAAFCLEAMSLQVETQSALERYAAIRRCTHSIIPHSGLDNLQSDVEFIFRTQKPSLK